METEVPFEKVVFIDPAETIMDGVSNVSCQTQFTKRYSNQIWNDSKRSHYFRKKPNVIVVPQKAVTSKNGKKTITLLVNGQNIEQEITTGSVSSYGEIEITSGLSEGRRSCIAGWQLNVYKIYPQHQNQFVSGNSLDQTLKFMDYKSHCFCLWF